MGRSYKALPRRWRRLLRVWTLWEQAGLCRGRRERRPPPDADQLIQPSSRIAHAACQIFVMCLIFPPENSMKYT
jgi:hypothetical protein